MSNDELEVRMLRDLEIGDKWYLNQEVYTGVEQLIEWANQGARMGGGLICEFVTPDDKTNYKPIASRVLVSRDMGGIGDILMCISVARGLKQRHKGCYLVFEIPKQYIPLLEHNPYIDEARPYSVRDVDSGDFEHVYDMSGIAVEYEGKSGRNVRKSRYRLFSEAANLVFVDKPIVVLQDSEKEWAKKFLADRSVSEKDLLIGISPRSAGSLRTPSAKVIEDYAKRVSGELKAKIIMLDSNKCWDFEAIEAINLNLRFVLALVNRCNVVVAPDSGLLHVAGALNRPLLAIFGPTDPNYRLDVYDNVRVYWPKSKYECMPCWYEGCDTKKCMSEIDVDELVSLTRELLT